MKRIIALLITIAVVAAACNGHGASSKDVTGQVPGATFGINHDVNGSETASSTKVEAWIHFDSKPSSNIRVRNCMIYVLSDTATGDQVGEFEEGCSTWRWTDDVSNDVWNQGLGWTYLVKSYYTLGTLATKNGVSASGKTINAYESWVELRQYGSSTIHTCEYHDSDDSNLNDAWCDAGRDANGNLR